MKDTILKYGGYGALAICLLFLLAWYAGSGLSFGAQEVIGYASMVLALSFVYFGIRHYREIHNDGALTLKQGLRVGLGITLITALAFGLLDVVYVTWLNPDFMDTYYATVLTQMQAELPEAEFLQQKAEMEAQKALFTSPAVNFLLMFFTVFLIGFVITLSSAMILKRNPGTPAA
ncbi:DUF4199 domain-containing protein [Robiginitalea sp. M366]|uniref:DUF4199 domain-containing protein n=1 Tax=Robiginitalea aestuariiviva TaxID=3036903 RepID=UPI00240DD736|nr:DUF4199 domain-containing protein [Robiginitalea aestuariiviva]MDG1571195.1 DUF4199 domain-containing protein [Robiginitalea aestuariiviva]